MHRIPRSFVASVALLLATTTLAACGGGSKSHASKNTLIPGTTTTGEPGSSVVTAPGADIHTIKHVIVIMQENRSFDSYFGTFPGADGIPANVCIPLSRQSTQCVKPFVDHADVNGGGPHGAANAIADVDR